MQKKTAPKPPETVPKKIYLTAKDISQSLKDRSLQVLWTDGTWWPVLVTNVNIRTKRATLLYNTGAWSHDGPNNLDSKLGSGTLHLNEEHFLSI